MTLPSFSVGEDLTAADMNAVGLWKVTSGTITNTTQERIQGCFTTNYVNYLVTLNVTAGTNNTELFAQLMTGNTEATTNYSWVGVGSFANGTTNNAGAAAGNSFPVTFVTANDQDNSTQFYVNGPQTNTYTNYGGDWLYDDGGGAAAIIGRRIVGRHKTVAQYDGLRIFGANAFTGSYVIYGYRN